MLATTDLPGSIWFQAHILKVSFLVIVAILTFQSFTPPEKPPMEREQEKAEAAPGIMRRYPRVQKVLWGCKIASMVRPPKCSSWFYDPNSTNEWFVLKS